MKKLILYFTIGVILIMNSCKTNDNQKKDSDISAKLTEMQKFMAEKAIKMPTENNPVIAYKFGADPAVLVYKDTAYLYATNDMQQFEFSKGKIENNYGKIASLNIFSSKDLVNWTNHGEIQVAGKSNPKAAAKWANNSWAPAVAWKNIDGKDKFFIYFADNGSGIGVLVGESPTGPFVDPLKKQLISRQTPKCADVNWLFDPAVFVDDDGRAYIYFGGGHNPDNAANPKTARCVELGDDMISIKGEPQVIDPPFLFEDSGIHKYKDTYYYTYCTNWVDRKDYDTDIPIAVIGYMTSKNPLGPFEYKGWTLPNPGEAPLYAGGNNHHWVFNFKDRWYIAYHAPTIEKTLKTEKKGYRNLFIDEFKFNDDMTLPHQRITKEGVKQVQNFNPGDEIPAATFAYSGNVGISNDNTLISVKNGGYVCIKSVQFPSENCEITVKYTPLNDKKELILKTRSFGENGTEIGKVKLSSKGVSEAKLTISKDALTSDLFLVLPENCELISWQIK